MGIKSLTKLIKQKAPDSIVTSQYHKLSGKRIAIDASLYIYQCFHLILLLLKHLLLCLLGEK